MVLEPYNLIKYLLSTSNLHFEISKCKLLVSFVNQETDRNAVLGLNLIDPEGKEHDFIFKQPNSLDLYGVRFINNERAFYQFIEGKNLDFISKFQFYDETFKILCLKKSKHDKLLKDDNFTENFVKLKEKFSEIGKTLKVLHNNLNDNSVEQAPFSAAFVPINNLKILLKELPNLEKFDFDSNTILPDFHNFLSKTKISNKIIEILNKWGGNNIIHGDFHYKNILLNEKSNELLIIDFELAGVGDIRWDLANFIFSILVESKFENVLLNAQLHELINAFISSYDNTVSIESIVEFIAIKAIWSYWSNIFNDNSPLISLKKIESMLTNPKDYEFVFLIGQEMSKKSKADIDDYFLKNNINL